MDRISGLPDAMLLKILSLLPTAKEVVASMVLSKRWEFLWMYVPSLVYDDSHPNLEYGTFARFVDRSLCMHEAPVIETLHFKIGKICGAGDIKFWIRAANKHSVREMIIEMDYSSSAAPAILPKSVYTAGKTLVTLKLNKVFLVDVSCSFSFPSLKTLSLLSVKYSGDAFVKRFLSSCPVLEELRVEQCPNDNVIIFTVIVPSLISLVLRTSDNRERNVEFGFVMDAPSLETFAIRDHRGGFCLVENAMPKIVQADVDVTRSHPGKILSSITLVKHLYLCLSTSEGLYPVGSVFHLLVHLKICTCKAAWLNLLLCVLKDSPTLKSLKLEQTHNPLPNRPRWIEPSSVPNCLLSSLETFEWVKYEGTKEEKELAGFILRNGSCLKKVTISSESTDRDKKLEMVKELTLSVRGSPNCQLAFT